MTFLKISLCLLLMFSFLFCRSSKPKTPRNVEEWLNAHFPGQYQVISSNLRVLDIMAQFKGEKLALIADKTRPDLQFLLDWQKDGDTLGLSDDKVKGRHELAAKSLERSDRCLSALKQHYPGRFSVGFSRNQLWLLVFEDATPDNRKKLVAAVREALGAELEDTDRLQVTWMEPASYHTECQDIVPAGLPHISMGWLRNNGYLSAFLLWEEVKKPWAWEVVTESGRASAVHDKALQAVKDWAAAQKGKTCIIMEDWPYTAEQLKTTPSVRYGFPYCKKQPPADAVETEPDGYIGITWHFDEDKYDNIAEEKD